MDFVGVGEIRRMLGVSRARVGQLVGQPGFPSPVAVLEAGRIWDVEDVERWIEQANRPPAERVSGVPRGVLRTLLVGFTAYEADSALRRDAKRGSFFHAGDPMGKVVAWLWRERPDDAMDVIAHYLEELRVRHPAAPDPKITLDDVLRALGPAMPNDFRREEFEALCERARADVPGLFGGGVD